ncbi:alpha/beta fold hydrolase [Thermomonas aquatica]|nr:alpha/beta hydrolase [Thermomonas aquatica]
MTPRVAIQDRHVAIPAGDVFVRRWMPVAGGSRAPLILLHDSLGCVELWRDFPGLLAQRLQRPVLAYDRLGFGKSAPRAAIPGPEFIDEEARRDFPALRAALGIERHLLFGHSVGGGMALCIAADAGDDCLAVVSESAQAFVEPRTLEGIRAAQAAFADPLRFERLERVHGDKARWVLAAWTGVWLSPAFADWNLDAALARVGCPLLAIHGERDEYGSLAFPQRIVAHAGGPAEAMILPGCGHVPHREQADAVLERVAAFAGAIDA